LQRDQVVEFEAVRATPPSLSRRALALPAGRVAVDGAANVRMKRRGDGANSPPASRAARVSIPCSQRRAFDVAVAQTTPEQFPPDKASAPRPRREGLARAADRDRQAIWRLTDLSAAAGRRRRRR
jgi:hypothetical protein